VALIAAVGATLLALPAAAAASGTISGRVTPVEVAHETEVCVVEVSISRLCTYPQADGTYAMTGIPLGAIKVEFLPSYRSQYVPQFYNHARTLAEATSITLTAQGSGVGNVDAELEFGGVIEGKVTAAVGGASLAGVEVCAIEAVKKVPNGCGFTNAAGEYHLGALPVGAYKVGFWGHGASAEYAPSYYHEASTLATATPISVNAGAVRAGIDASLAEGAKVLGTVRAAAGGSALAEIPVCLFAGSAITPTQCTYSEGSGAYSLVGIPGGSYQVGFSLGSAEIGGEEVSSEDDGYLTQYYPLVPNRSEGQVLMLGTGQVATGVDGSLLAPPPPAPAPPAPVVTNSIVAAPLTIAEPKPKTTGCKKGYKKKRVKGKVRCVKVSKGKSKDHKGQKKVH
jgi:hypothetical protein